VPKVLGLTDVYSVWSDAWCIDVVSISPACRWCVNTFYSSPTSWWEKCN